ncbi:SU(VAR)3-9 [Theobroma cacao]|uniref:SU(VAR)3-9 n=1 Tax=Theobroma cacao TaxID=3641 RepID=A0A061G6V1_THECC|nr:SU(VAR)3-9 [Theobroma cacao]
MVGVILSRRHCGFPSKFKRPGVSPVRKASCHTEFPVKPNALAALRNQTPSDSDPPKLQKGRLVLRNFPVKPNAPAVLRNQMPFDSEDRHSAYGIPMADCEQLDASNATNVHACRDTKQYDFSLVRNSKPLYVPNSTNVRDIHACIEPKQGHVSMVDKDCKPMDVSIATNVFACSDVKESSPSMVVADEQYGVDNYQGVLKDDEGDEVPSSAKQASLSKVVWNEQCLNVDFSDEECEEDLMEAYNSQVIVSEDLAVTDNKELRIASEKVKEVIHLFREIYLKLSQESDGKQKQILPLLAASHLLKQQKWINMHKRLGPIPGVKVGDYFSWRAELNIIGLHRQHMCGIDYMELDGRILATSIVDSGRYDNVVESNDEQEFPNVLIYSGQGENLKFRSRKLVNDQKLEGGNLALKNSAETKTPIRVIRKFCFKGASSKIVDCKYVYDGLYFVDGYREEKASSGAEGIPIRAMNALDDEKPPLFNYVTNVTYPISYHPSMSSGGCDWSDGCFDSEDCPCVVKNDREIPCNYEDCIMMEKPFIIDCGLSCEILPDKEVEQRIGKDEYLLI